MHADELDIDLPLVRRLVASQFPDWADLAIEPVLPLGTDNANYRLGEDMVIRLPRRPHSVQSLLVEFEWLPRLAPKLPLDIPTPVAPGEPGEGYPLQWAIYTWLEGEPAAVDRLVGPVQTAMDLARFIAALQRIDPAGGPTPARNNAWRGVPLSHRDAATRAAIGKLGDELDAALMTAMWEECLAAPEWDRPPVWLHGDLDSRNMLAKGGRLSAAIDFGCLVVGDPACDVSVAWKLLTAEGRRIFREELRIDDATWLRSRGWTLSQSLIALPYYTMETNPTLVLEARRWLGELVEGSA